MALEAAKIGMCHGAGNVDLGLYTEDCLFADPTFSFRGRQKYERNLRTLTAFFVDPEIQLFSLAEGDGALKVPESPANFLPNVSLHAATCCTP